MNTSLEILTRTPAAGRAKTRLIPRLGAEGAARLHAALAEATFDLAAASGLPVTVHLDGDLESAFAAAIRARGFGVVPQVEGDLGARLRAATAQPGRRVLLGTDCVTFDPAWLEVAASDPAPVVLGPAEDGGYWTLALDAPCPALFEQIPWSTEAVAAATLAAAARLGRKVKLLPTCYDIDAPPDLLRLAADPACPRALRERISLLLSSCKEQCR